MENSQQPQNCPICQSPMKEKAGISKKTGKPYNFWGCSNYPTCNYIWRPPTDLKSAKEIIRETKVIPVLRLDEKDKEELLNAMRKIYQQGEEIKGILGTLQRVDIYYPKNKGKESNESYLETKPPK